MKKTTILLLILISIIPGVAFGDLSMKDKAPFVTPAGWQALLVSSSSSEGYQEVVCAANVASAFAANLINGVQTSNGIVYQLVPIRTSVSKADIEVTTSDKSNTNLVLFGRDNQLVKELQEAGKLPAVQSQGLLAYVRDAFATGRDVIVVTGTNAANLRTACDILTNQIKYQTYNIQSDFWCVQNGVPSACTGINAPPKITFSSGPTSLDINQYANFAWAAEDADKDVLRWSVNWGDGRKEPMGCDSYSDPTGLCWKVVIGNQGWKVAGYYQITATATDSKGASAYNTRYIRIGNPPSDSFLLQYDLGEWKFLWSYNGSQTATSDVPAFNAHIAAYFNNQDVGGIYVLDFGSADNVKTAMNWLKSHYSYTSQQIGNNNVLIFNNGGENILVWTNGNLLLYVPQLQPQQIGYVSGATATQIQSITTQTKVSPAPLLQGLVVGSTSYPTTATPQPVSPTTATDLSRFPMPIVDAYLTRYPSDLSSAVGGGQASVSITTDKSSYNLNESVRIDVRITKPRNLSWGLIDLRSIGVMKPDGIYDYTIPSFVSEVCTVDGSSCVGYYVARYTNTNVNGVYTLDPQFAKLPEGTALPRVTFTVGGGGGGVIIPAGSYRNSYWQCYDGTASSQGGSTSCKSSGQWLQDAQDFCSGHCDSAGKCGVNTFQVYNECNTTNLTQQDLLNLLLQFDTLKAKLISAQSQATALSQFYLSTGDMANANKYTQVANLIGDAINSINDFKSYAAANQNNLPAVQERGRTTLATIQDIINRIITLLLRA